MRRSVQIDRGGASVLRRLSGAPQIHLTCVLLSGLRASTVPSSCGTRCAPGKMSCTHLCNKVAHLANSNFSVSFLAYKCAHLLFWKKSSWCGNKWHFLGQGHHTHSYQKEYSSNSATAQHGFEFRSMQQRYLPGQRFDSHRSRLRFISSKKTKL